MLTPLIFLVSLSTLAVAQCPCYPYSGDVICDRTNPTSIPDCVASNITKLRVWTPSITLEAATFERFTALISLSIGYYEKPVIAKDMLKYLGHLQDFEISRTDVDYIDNEWFMFSPRITVLWLSDNRLAYLAPDTFRYLPRLETVALYNNQMMNLTPALFQGTNITTLYLGNNPWQCDCELATFVLWTQQTGVQIDDAYAYAKCAYPDDLRGINIKNLTTSLPRLEMVTLYNNQLMSLTPALFQRTSITTLYLDNNPWHCDCELATFRLWTQQTGVEIYDYAYCAHPDDLQGLNIKNLTTSLAC